MLQIFTARQSSHTPWDFVVHLCRMFATDAYRQNPLTMTLTFSSSQASERLVRVLAYRLQMVMFQLLSDILEPLASCNGRSASTIDQRVTLLDGVQSIIECGLIGE